MTLYEQACVWAVTGSGIAVVVAFAVFFCVTVWKLVRTALRPAPLIQAPTAKQRCPACGGALGEVTEGVALAGTPYERRKCQACGKQSLVERE